MEIEDQLKAAANWQPHSEMPLGLERRALASRRPPLRPIGFRYPTAFASTALAGAASALFFHLSGGKTEATPPPPALVAQETKQQPEAPPKKIIPVASQPAPRAHPRSTRTSPRRKRYSVEASDPIVVESRIAVDEPVYAPAYYAQPSEDGQSVQYTPVVASLGDPDVIYTP